LSTAQRLGCSLFRVVARSDVYRRRPNGDLQYDGERPGPDWISHGYFCSAPLMLEDGCPRPQVVWKHRWRLAGTNHTCHSRPPDLPVGFQCCLLLVAVKLWSWLEAGHGLHTSKERFPALNDVISSRTKQRWLRRLRPHARRIEQASRLAVINESESRPLERLFPSGLAPPEKLRRKHWLDASSVCALWTALALLFGASDVLNKPLVTLLAETRRRFDALKNTP
jgi:hypothetical protein